MNKYDVIVVGGGASGMMAAGRAAECGRRVLLVEKNPTLGEKLSITGGGRCNITNAELDVRSFLSFFGEAGKFLFSPFSRYGVQDTFDFFEGRGLPLVVEDQKRAFPASQQAPDVTRVLAEYVREHDVTVRYGVQVHHLRLADGAITGIETSQGPFEAESVILATGGAAYQETGSTGDGFNWLRDVGHQVHAATPDVVPLRVQDAWVKDLSGSTLDPMTISFTAKDGSTLSKSGKLLFTHFGLSGPLILNSANQVKKLLEQGPVSAVIKLYPRLDPVQLDKQVLERFADNSNRLVRSVTKVLTPTGLGLALAAHLPADLLEKRVNAVTLSERKEIVHRLQSLSLTVTGTMGYDWAVVCDGGVALTEVDTRSMRSRLHPNLFIVGDLLHISRPSGGYSLQLCWTTGTVAGENA
jgi:predicted Rossmann fold flavoprotein